ncbi:uncharacterized protein A4U43_C06F2380 [Asparagus officinalis]|uniref:Kinesin-like protein n=1 Tax=Asparagus officinalis TaxID=4686 RepID=A0A5P1EJJ1_ASPOF|nr:uncharacterized protein A4U43_C06F2380 [Asparagus officinalis]
MYSRGQNIPRAPSTTKENLDETPMDKRRRITVGKMVGPNTTNLRPRQVLSAVNVGPADPTSAANSDAGSTVGGIEFSSREDVERLLSEKIKGKFKTDLKGKNEQMIEYIKKLKACIRWFMELEDGYLLEQEKLRSLSEAEEKRHAEIETQMKINIEELNSRIEDLQGQCASLQEKLSREEAEKLAISKSFREEAEARVASDRLRASLAEELERTTEDLKRNSDQIKLLQDTNKRLQEYNTSLQQYNSNLQAESVKTGEAISKMHTEKTAMMETIASLRDHTNLLKSQLDSSRSSQQEAIKLKEELRKEVGCLRAELQQVRDDRDHQLSQVQSLSIELANYKELTGKTSKELDTITTTRTTLEATCSSQKERIQLLESQVEAANEKLKRADLTAIEVMTEYEEQKNTIKVLQNRVIDADIQIFEAEKLRKKLHNTILVCIFAYGQTGSGKTYTMMGQPEASEQKGLIPRSLEQIFQISQSLESQGWKYKMQASMLEIYNETIRDLLAPIRSSNFDATAAHSKFAIKHDSNGNTHVSDLTVVDVCSIKEVSFLLRQAAQSRSVGRTQMNEQSSRSHFVFTLRISGVNESTDQHVQGVLNLIDLAGSERLAKSGSTGDRLKETQAINKSLSALSDVIFAIAKKDDHVPYRNSKLTYLLQPCLGGDSKTLMFVNISPEVSSAGESICSLRFAARVNSCEIGIPRRQTQMRSLDSRLSYG